MTREIPRDKDQGVARRSVIGALPAMLSRLAGFPTWSVAQDRVPAATRTKGRPSRLAAMPEGVPRAAFLPTGFRLSYIARSGQTGFRTDDEILALYGNPKASARYPYPLQVYAATGTALAFWGTDSALPQQTPILNRPGFSGGSVS